MSDEKQKQIEAAHAAIRRHWFRVAKNTVLRAEALRLFQEVKARIAEVSPKIGDVFPVEAAIINDQERLALVINCQNRSIIFPKYAQAALLVDGSNKIAAVWDDKLATFTSTDGGDAVVSILDAMFAEVFRA